MSRFTSSAETNIRTDGFDSLVRRHWDRLWHYACRLCDGDIHDAGDLLSEGLLDAFRSFRSYRGYGFEWWLRRILSDNRIDMQRSARRRPTQSLGSEALEHEWKVPDSRDEPERLLFRQIYSEQIETALAQLPEPFRIAVLLCDVEELEYQEIATLLDLPIGTVRSRVHRGRSRLREMLADVRTLTP